MVFYQGSGLRLTRHASTCQPGYGEDVNLRVGDNYVGEEKAHKKQLGQRRLDAENKVFVARSYAYRKLTPSRFSFLKAN